MDEQNDKETSEKKKIRLKKNCFWCGILCCISGLLLALERYDIISLCKSVRLLIDLTLIIIIPTLLFTCVSDFWIQDKIQQKLERQSILDRDKYKL